METLITAKEAGLLSRRTKELTIEQLAKLISSRVKDAYTDFRIPSCILTTDVTKELIEKGYELKFENSHVTIYW